MMFSYVLNKLNMNGKELALMPLPAYITKIIMPQDGIYVLRYNVDDVDEYKVTFDLCRNIFAVSDKGDVLWQIERAPHYSEYMTGEHEGEVIPNPFTGVWITDAGVLKGYAHGYSYEINPLTGKLSNAEFVK